MKYINGVGAYWFELKYETTEWDIMDILAVQEEVIGLQKTEWNNMNLLKKKSIYLEVAPALW